MTRKMPFVAWRGSFGEASARVVVAAGDDVGTPWPHVEVVTGQDAMGQDVWGPPQAHGSMARQILESAFIDLVRTIELLPAREDDVSMRALP